MVLFIRGTNYEDALRYVEVIDEGNEVLTLRLYATDNGDAVFLDETTVDLKKVFKPYNFCALYATDNYSGQAVFSAVVDYNNVSRSRDEVYFQNYYATFRTAPLVVFYCHSAPGEHVIVVNAPVKTAMEHQVAEDTPAPQLALAQYPALQKKINIWNYRRDMMDTLDPNNSLAYIEAQLDAITKVVFAVLAANPDAAAAVAADFPEFEDFTTSLKATSVFTVKAAAQCLGEINQTKTRVREMQAQYYATKQQNR